MKYGRKFFLAMLVIATATALRVADLIDAGQWVAVTAGALTVYMGANVGQKAVQK